MYNKSNSSNLIDQQSEQYRRGQILGFTMAEIMLVLLFLLLLLMGSKLSKINNLLDDSITKDMIEYRVIEVMSNALDSFKKTEIVEEHVDLMWLTEALILAAPVLLSNGDDIEDIKKLGDMINSNIELKIDLEESVNRVKEVENELEIIKELLASTSEELQIAINDIAILEQSSDQILEKATQNRNLRSILEEINISFTEALQCLMNCGGGPKTCWGESLRNPDFIYNIALFDNKVFVSPDTESINRNRDDWNKMPAQARIESSVFLSNSEFRSRMSHLLNYGKNNDCVFQSRLVDVDTSTKDIYIQQRRLVEGYMYPTHFNNWSYGNIP